MYQQIRLPRKESLRFENEDSCKKKIFDEFGDDGIKFCRFCCFLAYSLMAYVLEYRCFFLA